MRLVHHECTIIASPTKPFAPNQGNDVFNLASPFMMMISPCWSGCTWPKPKAGGFSRVQLASVHAPMESKAILVEGMSMVMV